MTALPDPLKVLELPDTATEADVKTRWKHLAGLHHPDRGGDATMFAMFNDAYHQAIAAVRNRALEKCPNCFGAKSVHVRHGFYQALVMCPECRGSGTRG